MADLSEVWNEHGKDVLARLAKDEPAALAKIAYGILPRDLMVSVEQRIPGNLPPEDWALMLRVLDTIKKAVPPDKGADDVPEIFGTIEHALRAHYAVPIEGD